MEPAVSRIKLPLVGLVSVFLAAVAYNNWVLGRWLNPVLFKANGSVSEFSVHGQPHYLVFKSLDILSGLLLVLAAGLFLKTLSVSRLGRFILAATALLGVANIFDAVFALPCSETLNPNCLVPISISLSHFVIPSHGYSSTVIAVCYLILPLAGLIYGLRRRLWVAFTVSLVTVADALSSLGLALANYANAGTISVRTSGAGQEVEMVILAGWLVIFYFYIYRSPEPMTKLASARIRHNGGKTTSKAP